MFTFDAQSQPHAQVAASSWRSRSCLRLAIALTRPSDYCDFPALGLKIVHMFVIVSPGVVIGHRDAESFVLLSGPIHAF
jgi:hypothetical protein